MKLATLSKLPATLLVVAIILKFSFAEKLSNHWTTLTNFDKLQTANCNSLLYLNSPCCTVAVGGS